MTVSARTLTLTSLDPGDERSLAWWVDLQLAWHRYLPPDVPPPCPADLRGSVLFRQPGRAVTDWLLTDGDGVPVGSARLDLPAGDPRPVGTVSHLALDGPHASEGTVATALDLVRREAAGRGCVAIRGDVPVEPGTAPPPELRPPAGARPAGRLLHNVLDVGARGLPDAAAPPPPPPGYAVTHCRSVVPDHLLPGVAALDVLLETGTEPGDLAPGELGAAVAGVKDFERMRVGRGRRAYQTFLRHEDGGEVVARGLLSMTASDPTRGLLANAVVHPAHRGSGLTAHVWAQAPANYRAESRLELLDCYNDAGNAAVLRVVELLGFEVVGELCGWELDV